MGNNLLELWEEASPAKNNLKMLWEEASPAKNNLKMLWRAEPITESESGDFTKAVKEVFLAQRHKQVMCLNLLPPTQDSRGKILSKGLNLLKDSQNSTY